ncbi:predicted protein [Nematostella vectensis]|uniref:O-acyltransferase WSD1 C-terminal domain-containing protein n=1 Tax=Nematostella vectensis TaxID=45351 RepID=A7T0H6_NEMVE|nr:uncharacterized protein LOC5501335 [Nematostella vectensis]EDO30538.1 predicted protein [Nematostella vectensis]|eukprot:XP_001622638.1 predicted protein [Nematostella vectensis]
MSTGHASAWASPRISDHDRNYNEEILSPSTKITKRRKRKIKRLRHPTESYLFLKFIQFLTVFVLNIALFSLCVGFCVSLLPIVLLVRKLVGSCCVKLSSRSGNLRAVNSLDALWLLPCSKVNNVAVTSIFFLVEGQITQEEIRDFIDENWLYYCNTKKNFRFPKLREFAVKICSGFAWKPIANFQTRNFILTSTDDNKLFQDYFNDIENSDYLRPEDAENGKQFLWRIVLFPNFSDSEDTGFLLEMHRSLADVFPLSRLALSSLGYKTVYLRDRCYPVQQACLGLSTAFAGPLMVVKRMLLPRPKCLLDEQMSEGNCGEKTVLWSEAIDFRSIKKIKDITRTKVDIVLMSCLAGALRSFLYKCGDEVPADVRACVQTDIRAQHSKLKLDSKFSAMFVDLPSGTEGAVPRLWETRRRMDTFSSVIERHALHAFLKFVLLILPISFARRFVDYTAGKSSCTVTYIAGPNTPVYLNGKMAKLMTILSPRITGQGLSLSLVTHANQVRLGIVAHQRLPCDPKILLNDFQREIDELHKHLSNRTLPSHLRVRARQQVQIDERGEEQV